MRLHKCGRIFGRFYLNNLKDVGGGNEGVI